MGAWIALEHECNVGVPPPSCIETGSALSFVVEVMDKRLNGLLMYYAKLMPGLDGIEERAIAIGIALHNIAQECADRDSHARLRLTSLAVCVARNVWPEPRSVAVVTWDWGHSIPSGHMVKEWVVISRNEDVLSIQIRITVIVQP